jgi:hypothetical protein
MSGAISSRACSQLYYCENCELHQTIQDDIDRQAALKKAASKKRSESEIQTQVKVKQKPMRTDH